MTAQELREPRLPSVGARARQRLVMWLILAVLAALVTYFGFRGYLSPDLLLHFANGLHC
ncbi:MAG: hypothetical protein ACXW2I_05950 [Burkholderiales bacterium]